MPESQISHYHVFLSHNSRDKDAVELLADMLKKQGLNPFLDKWNPTKITALSLFSKARIK